MGRSFLVVLAVAVAGVTVTAADAQTEGRAHESRHVRIQSTASTAPLRTALMDSNLFDRGSQQEEAFALTRAAGATYVRLLVKWEQYVSAQRPSSAVNASDPASPIYNWAPLDATVQGAEQAGLAPILDIEKPPAWAAVKAPRGNDWATPNIAALHSFARALAAHYDGQGAPAVHAFEVWNEPNLSLYLNPTSPDTYRNMVNAVAASVHAVDPANLVIAGSLDPFENRAQRFHTMAPLAFMRRLLCLSNGPHPHRTCHDRIDFDVWSHHPYTFGGPFGHARLADDVSLGDLPRMTKLLHAAEHLHQIISKHKVQFWVTEFGWDTNPPNRHALRIALQARGTAEALHQMWLSGISLVTWYLLQDEPSNTPFQSGLYFGGKSVAHARPKPTLTAFRFPFVAYLGSGGVSIWGRDATSDKKVVTIQLGSGARWRTVARIRTNRYGIFLANLPLHARPQDWMRALAPGSGTSLAFSLIRPHYPHVGPWGT